MAFERGEVLEVVSPFLVDGDMVHAGDLIEVPSREADQLRKRGKAKTPDGKAAKRVPENRAR